MAVAYWICYAFTYVDSSAQWRFPIALQIFFAAATISLIVWLPDTPRWLLSHHRNEEAIEVLTKLHEGHEDPEIVEQERIEIVAAITREQQAQEKFGGRLVLILLLSISVHRKGSQC